MNRMILILALAAGLAAMAQAEVTIGTAPPAAAVKESAPPVPAAQTPVGELTLKAGDADGMGWSASMSGAADVKPAPADCGTVNPAAKVITLRLGEGTLLVALDSAKADDKVLDVIKVDTTGKGKFTADASLPIKWMSGADGAGSGNAGPATVKLTHDGREVPVTLRGYVMRDTSGGITSLFLRGAVSLEGACAFGDKIHTVRFVDVTGNLRMDDALKFAVKDGAPVAPMPGDMVMIDPAPGARGTPSAMVGSPVRVDGTWYDLALSADQKKVTATPLKGPFGKLKFNADTWTAMLLCGDRLFMLMDVKDAVEMPAGKYILAQGMFSKGGVMIGCSDQARFMQGKAEAFEIAAGKTVEDFMGPPFTGRVEVTGAGDTRTLTPSITDAHGLTVSNIMVMPRPDDASGKAAVVEGRPPSAGSIEITTADGKSVYSAALVFS
jgi:hypothetical protein